MALRSRPIPNIYQGVSQQNAQTRRDAQCDAQQDCVNSPRLGVVARSGADVQAFMSGLQMPGAFTYEVLRGSVEHYLMTLYQGTLNIYDLTTFTLCSTTALSGSTYLYNPGGGVLDEDNFRAQTVGDYTFIINKSIAPQMSSASAYSTPNPAAIVFFQAGNYLTEYVITVEYAGNLYTFSYQTPDNSVAGNYSYIQTNQLCATFFYAMTGTSPSTGGTGVGVGGSGFAGVSSTTYTSGAGGGKIAGSLSALPALGFKVVIEGNLLLIERASDTNPFTVDATDGSGDQAVTVIQNEVNSLSQLPKGGFQGFIIKVTGVNGQAGNVSNTSAAYYLTYNSTAGDGGAWVECPGPGVLQTFNAATMPVAVFCSAVDTFQVVAPNWLPRIAGDGATACFNPGFVGKYLTDICYINGRLGLITTSTYDLTEAANPYNFWPATAQIALDSDPISGQLAASNTTSILTRAQVVDEQLTLWAQRAQFRMTSGVYPFTAANIQVPQSTAYEFSDKAGFTRVGVQLYFAYEADGFASVFNLQFQQGKAIGDTDITAHVQAYIPAGIRGFAVSTPIKMIFLRTDGAANSLYLYNYLEEGSAVVQSAWNVWNLPAGELLWHGIYEQFLYVLLQRTEGAYFLTVPLNPSHVDPGGAYQTRLDMRLSEAQVTSAVYNATTNRTTITFPYTLLVAEQAKLNVVIRTTDSSNLRGKICTVMGTTANTVTVEGNISASQFYVGLIISSQRTESPFYIRTATGHIPTERLTVKNYWLDYNNTAYTRIVITNLETGDVITETLGIPETVEMGSPPALSAGSLRALVDGDALKVSVVAINDSPFPSQWTAVTIDFESVERATPMLTPYGGPVQ